MKLENQMSMLPFQSMEDVTESEIKAQISSHPLYPNLLSAYINCRKVGLPPEMASLFEEISKKTLPSRGGCEIRADPELDDFMESYCRFLQRYKEELSKPFDDATSFLSDIKSQLSHLCKESFNSGSGNCHSDEGAGCWEEDISCGEVETVESQDSTGGCSGDQAVKEMLLRKYSGYISCLRNGFLNKKKKGKLPKDARTFLLDWWNTNYRWPYPTEEEKVKLAEISGLEHKQINNWFINQRKRHWRPDDISNGSRITEPACFDYTIGGTGRPDFDSGN